LPEYIWAIGDSIGIMNELAEIYTELNNQAVYEIFSWSISSSIR
jgi:hypothetical protein